MRRRVNDEKVLHLLDLVLGSFGQGRGLPLGNLTSQWISNIYLHELDHFVKHTLRIRRYLRYNDDMMVFGARHGYVAEAAVAIQSFASERLRLCIPDEKIAISCLPAKLDILGMYTDGTREWLRLATRRRAERRIGERMASLDPALYDIMCSYSGMGIVIPPVLL